MVTSLLFLLGKFAMGLYLGSLDLGSAYGAAGSLVVILLWIYYAAMIFFFGAEFTRARMKLRGERVDPEEGAASVVHKVEKVSPQNDATAKVDTTAASAADGPRQVARQGCETDGKSDMSGPLEQLLNESESEIDQIQQKWLQPLGPAKASVHRVMHTVVCAGIRGGFRFQVEGLDRLPQKRPLIFASNHESSLDAPVLAAALPYRILRNTFWAGRKGKLLGNRMTRALSRVARAIPIDRDLSALAAGEAVLKQGNNLVWFPEGTRSRDGTLQEFKAGVGVLAKHSSVTVIPVRIEGTFEACPPGARFPRLRSKISVRFGDPLSIDQVDADEAESKAFRELAEEVHDRVEQLS